MTYCARYRFKLLTRLQTDASTPVDVSLPNLPVVRFEIGDDAHPVGCWVTAKIEGFATEEDAREAGQLLGDTLLVVGAVATLGIDIGFSRSTVGWSAAIHDAVREQTGREIRPETHGLMVYEKDKTCILDVHGRGSVSICPDAFGEKLINWSRRSSNLTERQRNCAALLNDSYFTAQPEGCFILRISAVEALCDQAVQDRRYLGAIEALERELASQTLDNDIRETLGRILLNAKRQSLRSAYLSKFKTLRSGEEAREFDKLYQLRSKLVHDGVGRGTLNEAAGLALRLATDLLAADLNSP